MNQPVKYLKIVAQMLAIYQKELLRYAKKYPQDLSLDFKRMFNVNITRLKQTQIQKAIDDAVSPHCADMVDFLKDATQKTHPPNRLNKTSIEPRKNLRSQAGTRMMRMTGNLKRSKDETQAIEEQQELRDIIQSYKIQEQLVPRMRMKWKSAYEPQHKTNGKEISTIGSNNIDLLAYTIPQIENSIRRLSYQRSPQTTKQRELQVYRTLQSRSAKKKYIPRLF